MSYLQFYQEKMASASCFCLFILAFFIPIFCLFSILFLGNLYRSFLFPHAIGLLFVFFSFLLRYFYSLVSLGDIHSPSGTLSFSVIYLVVFLVRRLAFPLARFLTTLFLVFVPYLYFCLFVLGGTFYVSTICVSQVCFNLIFFLSQG